MLVHALFREAFTAQNVPSSVIHSELKSYKYFYVANCTFTRVQFARAPYIRFRLATLPSLHMRRWGHASRRIRHKEMRFIKRLITIR